MADFEPSLEMPLNGSGVRDIARVLNVGTGSVGWASKSPSIKGLQGSSFKRD